MADTDRRPGRVLIVAGSDSGGGAGIQADIKTVTALSAYAATAITALTAQNTTGVYGVHSVPGAFIVQQIELVLTDIGADAIKTGMLANTETIEAVADTLDRLAPDIPLIVDPVMRAKGGHKLLEDSAAAMLARRLVPRAAVVTPNLPEAEALLGGRTISSFEDMRSAGREILALGPRAVLMKGGHLDGDTVRDLLITEAGETELESPRVFSRNTHGTGCTLASAIAAGIAQGLDLPAAFSRAHAYVAQAIATAPDLGQGHGPLNHMHTLAVFR